MASTVKPEVYKRFAEIYVGTTCYNARRAYRMLREEMGFDVSDKDIDSVSCRYANNPTTRKWIAHYQEEFRNLHLIERQKNVAKLTEMAFADKDDKIYTPKIQLEALDKLNKMGGLYQDNLTISGDAEINITLED